MFLLSGTYEGNFLRGGGHIKLPPDLSFFDLRNYPGSIPQNKKINLMIQRVRFGTSVPSGTHLMVSLCVSAKDKLGRDGFFACRYLSPELSQIQPGVWFVESVAELYRYLTNEAPLENGGITHVPDPTSPKVVDFSHLQSKVELKKIAYIDIDWLSERGLTAVRDLMLDEKLNKLESFTLIFGDNVEFKHSLTGWIDDWLMEEERDQLDRKRKLEENYKRRVALHYKQAEQAKLWEELYDIAEKSCLSLMTILVLAYIIIAKTSGVELGLDWFCGLASLVVLGRTLHILFSKFQDRM